MKLKNIIGTEVNGTEVKVLIDKDGSVLNFSNLYLKGYSIEAVKFYVKGLAKYDLVDLSNKEITKMKLEDLLKVVKDLENSIKNKGWKWIEQIIE